MAEQLVALVVDDEPQFLEIIGAKLSSSGFHVETAGSGEEGMKKAKTLQPDLMLLDVKMPGMSGAEALLKLKDDPATKDIPVIFITNFSDPRAELQDIQEVGNRFSRDVGALGWVRKSDDLEKMLGDIRGLLSRPVADDKIKP